MNPIASENGTILFYLFQPNSGGNFISAREGTKGKMIIKTRDMQSTTRTIIQAAIEGDATLNEVEKEYLLATLMELFSRKSGQQLSNPELPRVVSRKEVALLIGRTCTRVDLLARAGLLKKVFGVGTRRAIGFTEASARSLVEGGIKRDIL